MTFTVNNEDDDFLVSELKLSVGGDNGDYLKLGESEDCEAVGLQGGGAQNPLPPRSTGRWRRFWWWAKVVVFLIFAGLLAAVFLKWVSPFFMDKEIVPIINWERSTFSTPVLATLLFTSVALFPSLLLPSTPSMWVAGMTFGYGFGFLLIIGAAAIGISLPYFIGSLFYHKIQGWLEKYPKKLPF